MAPCSCPHGPTGWSLSLKKKRTFKLVKVFPPTGAVCAQVTVRQIKMLLRQPHEELRDTHHRAGHGFCPCRFQSKRPAREETKCFSCSVRVQTESTLPKRDETLHTLMWNSRFSSMAKMWLKMSSAIRGMMPIW